MTERARNIVIAVALAGLAALLTGLYVTSYQRHVQRGEEHVTVFVAARDIPAGTSGADAIAHGMVTHKVVTRTATATTPGAYVYRWHPIARPEDAGEAEFPVPSVPPR